MLTNNFNDEKIFTLCYDFLKGRTTLHGLRKEEVDSHFYDAENFLRNIFKENIYNQNMFEDYFRSQIQRYEYSKGHYASYRGFYDPNPFEELYITDIKRGRLLKCKQKPDISKYDYEYGFDSDNKLIKVLYNGNKENNYQCIATEYIFIMIIFQYLLCLIG